jgi:hypothetical protein
MSGAESARRAFLAGASPASVSTRWPSSVPPARAGETQLAERGCQEHAMQQLSGARSRARFRRACSAARSMDPSRRSRLVSA